MTRNADFKRRIRERMARTGESYAAARAQLLPDAGRLHVTNGDITVELLKRSGIAEPILAWPDPRGLLEIDRSPELRFMREAFIRLAQEYPSRRDGLSLSERRLLAGTPGTRYELFERAWRKEARPFMGDSFAFDRLDRLAPLLHRDGDSLRLNDDGARILAGEGDFVREFGIDRWIGGVHLIGGEWRWDEGTETLVYAPVRA